MKRAVLIEPAWADVLDARESAVRSYSRAFPAIFATARGHQLISRDGREYIDFLSGAGSLNYGHNPEFIKRVLMDYLERDGLVHGLDLATEAKLDFLVAFQQHVLAPRDLPYRVQFCSPSGANAVEAAMKVARLVTGRTNIIAFSGGFHGVSTGALSATGSAHYKRGLYDTLPRVTAVPYPDSPLGAFDSLALLDRLVDDPSSGMEKPAAVILETVQGEGGIYVAPAEFLIGLRSWCTRHGILMIIDDIQVGCGRTGRFFSFEAAGVVPDLVTLSKSIGAYGLPMSILLIKPEYDIWAAGQHNGTFRGNQLAFIAATSALSWYWSDGVDGELATAVRRKGRAVAERLAGLALEHPGTAARGVGLVHGLDLRHSGISARDVSGHCFDRGLVVETCGREDEVLKILPPLTITDEGLAEGLDILADALAQTRCKVFSSGPVAADADQATGCAHAPDNDHSYQLETS